MTLYESRVAAEMAVWQQRMQNAPSFSSQLAKRFQNRFNRAIPEKIHNAITLAITGAGGILLGLADFPIWLTLKMKMLFEITALYGHDTSRYQERVYMLHIFELCFSSPVHRNKVYGILADWSNYEKSLPADINDFNWRNFQQEYRDYIDIAKLLQLVPGIGAAVGALVNHRLTMKLGKTAMNAYRMRWFGRKDVKALENGKV